MLLKSQNVTYICNTAFSTERGIPDGMQILLNFNQLIIKYFSTFNFQLSIIFITFASLLQQGEVLEWLKRHAWKACKPLKGFTGSNPVLSANNFPAKSTKYAKR